MKLCLWTRRFATDNVAVTCFLSMQLLQLSRHEQNSPKCSEDQRLTARQRALGQHEEDVRVKERLRQTMLLLVCFYKLHIMRVHPELKRLQLVSNDFIIFERSVSLSPLFENFRQDVAEVFTTK